MAMSWRAVDGRRLGPVRLCGLGAGAEGDEGERQGAGIGGEASHGVYSGLVQTKARADLLEAGGRDDAVQGPSSYAPRRSENAAGTPR